VIIVIRYLDCHKKNWEMVFFIIAASEKKNGAVVEPAQVEAKIKALSAFQKRGNQPSN